MKSIESHTIIIIQSDSPNWEPLEQEFKDQTGEELDHSYLWEEKERIFEYLKKWDMGGESEHSPQLWVGADDVRLYRRNAEILPGYTDTNPTVSACALTGKYTEEELASLSTQWFYSLNINEGICELSLDRWRYVEVCDDCKEVVIDEEEEDQICDDCAQDRADRAYEKCQWHHSWD